eukprot:gene676-783_t
MVMGDWAKGELVSRGLTVEEGFGCSAVPGTASYHLYNIDTLGMLATRESHRPAQEKLAALIMSPALQNDYNQIKGSIPVLRNPLRARFLEAVHQWSGCAGAQPGAPLAAEECSRYDEADLDGESLTVRGDARLLRRMLRNLLDNSLRHSESGAFPPELHLRLADDGRVLELEVRDHGRGVPPEHLPHLAQAFYRPDTARQRATGGVGLGLYLC